MTDTQQGCQNKIQCYLCLYSCLLCHCWLLRASYTHSPVTYPCSQSLTRPAFITAVEKAWGQGQERLGTRLPVNIGYHEHLGVWFNTSCKLWRERKKTPQGSRWESNSGSSDYQSDALTTEALDPQQRSAYNSYARGLSQLQLSISLSQSNVLQLL